MNKRLKELVRKASEQGWRVEKGHRNHLKWFSPDGQHLIVCGSTESDHRALHNTVSRLRRAGFHE